MRCEEVQILIPELSRGGLSPVAEDLLRTHLDDCKACTMMERKERALVASLRALPVAKMPAGFAARALRQAREADQAGVRRRQVRRMTGGAAMAASILLVSSVAFMLGRGLGDGSMAQPAMVELALGQSRMVALKIDAPQAFDHVEFEVTLPENVALAEQPELREFAWSGQLKAGTNVLSLPLVGIEQAGGELVATVTYGNTKKSLKIPLNVTVKS